ncbi:MAG: hypothetical protein AAF639_15205 [Chloroflexota bacterium]
MFITPTVSARAIQFHCAQQYGRRCRHCHQQGYWPAQPQCIVLQPRQQGIVLSFGLPETAYGQGE